MPSRGSGLAVAVASTTLSPRRTTAEPCACLANFPVSNVIFLPPARLTSTSVLSGFMIHPYRLGGQPDGLRVLQPFALLAKGLGLREGAANGKTRLVPAEPRPKYALCGVPQWAGRLPTEDSSLRNVRAASHARRGRPGALLLADAELRDHGLVPLGIVFLEVVEQATPLADQHE